MNENTRTAGNAPATDEQQETMELLSGLIDCATRCGREQGATTDSAAASDPSAAPSPQRTPHE